MSFRTHLVNGIENLLAPSAVNMGAPGDAPVMTEQEQVPVGRTLELRYEFVPQTGDERHADPETGEELLIRQQAPSGTIYGPKPEYEPVPMPTPTPSPIMIGGREVKPAGRTYTPPTVYASPSNKFKTFTVDSEGNLVPQGRHHGSLRRPLEETIELFLNEQDVNVDLVGAPDEEKLIDIGREQDQPEEVPPDEEDGFAGGLEDADLDKTGRNMAHSSFKKFEKAIIDAYDILSNDEDRVTFEDYLKTNVLLYLDKFEDELAVAGSLPEPSTPEYEQEKSDGAEMMPPEGGLPPVPAAAGLPPEEQVLQEYIELNI